MPCFQETLKIGRSNILNWLDMGQDNVKKLACLVRNHTGSAVNQPRKCTFLGKLYRQINNIENFLLTVKHDVYFIKVEFTQQCSSSNLIYTMRFLSSKNLNCELTLPLILILIKVHVFIFYCKFAKNINNKCLKISCY